MARKYAIAPLEVLLGQPNWPPGLLISLGDGMAVECTEEMLLLALNAPHDGSPLDDAALCKAIIAALIQQAQEKR